MPDPSLSLRGRWIAFGVLCLGNLMMVLDTTVVNVALPSIRANLGFTEASLVWVINAYLLTFGGFLLLGGRLGDLYGRRRLFVSGIIIFTAASLACGLAPSPMFLIIARAVQGVGGAVAAAVALSLMTVLFPEGPLRVRAMAFFGFVMASGGSIGVLVGGLLTGSLNWRWVFLVNIPVGIAVVLLSMRLVPLGRIETETRKLDVFGALTVTVALLLAVYAIVGADQAGWRSLQTLGLLGLAVALIGVFVAWESRIESPLMPLGLFRVGDLAVVNAVGVLWAAAMFAWFFLSALYLQRVMGYAPMKVGLAFLPANLIMAAFSLSLSAKTVERFGIRGPLAVGLLLTAAGLALFAMAPAKGGFWLHVLPAMSLLGLGAGLADNPILLAALNGVEEKDSGLASGLVNTSFMMGGALGLAVLASVAATRTGSLTAAGASAIDALQGGYQLAFWTGAACAAVAAAVGGVFIKRSGIAELSAH